MTLADEFRRGVVEAKQSRLIGMAFAADGAARKPQHPTNLREIPAQSQPDDPRIDAVVVVRGEVPSTPDAAPWYFWMGVGETLRQATDGLSHSDHDRLAG
jgi:hypothetical protein